MANRIQNLCSCKAPCLYSTPLHMICHCAYVVYLDHMPMCMYDRVHRCMALRTVPSIRIHSTYTYTRMHLCTYAHIHVSTHTRIIHIHRTHVYTYTLVHVYRYTPTRVYTYTRIRVYTYTYTRIRVHVHVHTVTYTRIHVHVHTYTYTSIHDTIFSYPIPCKPLQPQLRNTLPWQVQIVCVCLTNQGWVDLEPRASSKRRESDLSCLTWQAQLRRNRVLVRQAHRIDLQHEVGLIIMIIIIMIICNMITYSIT